jgi:hypothetical protein
MEGPMEADYPAAHSMDTTWFAVDKDGNVGMFRSGENGAVPERVLGDGLHEFFEISEQARLEVEFDYRVRRVVEQVARLGLFCYSHDNLSEFPFQSPYTLARRPDVPLHVDRLPPRLRSLAKKIRFGRVSFPDVERVQPVEHAPCVVWGGEEEIAYLAADGATVRPIPGREDRFAAFCEELRRNFPEEAARLRFEPAAENRDLRQT